MKKMFAEKESGFSLVELMIVVGIIGILATMAMPKFQEFQSKAKMAEAKTTLSHLYTLQHSYFLENDEYQSFPYVQGSAAGQCTNDAARLLGFEVQPCNAQVPRYQYRAVARASGQEFIAHARSKASVCQNGVVHYFAMNQNKSFAGPKSCRDAQNTYRNEGAAESRLR